MQSTQNLEVIYIEILKTQAHTHIGSYIEKPNYNV